MAEALELRGFGRPHSFSGKDEEWPDWSFVMRSYLSLIDAELAEVLEKAETITSVITLADLEQARPAVVVHVRHAYYQLAMTCKGPALGIIRAVERNNGVEAWRRLHKRFEPDGGPRLQNMMTRILQPGDFPDTATGFETALVAWEGLIEKWEQASGGDLDDQVKITVLMSRAPLAIRSFLQLQGITTYTRLREILVGYFISQLKFTDPLAGLTTGTVPMQVDALTQKGGKAKGKGKDKGKDRGKEVTCYHCGRKGHYKNECWYNAEAKHSSGDQDPKGKGKGKAKGKGKKHGIVNQLTDEVQSLKETIVSLGRKSSASEATASSSGTLTVQSLLRRTDHVVDDASQEHTAWAAEDGYVVAISGEDMREQWYVATHVLADNAADESVCPRWFAPEVPIVPCDDPMLRTANESRLQHLGQKTVTLEDKNGKRLTVVFKVCDVHGPILSVGRFTEKHSNRRALFSHDCAALFCEDGYKMELVRESRHWVLQCTVVNRPWKGSLLVPLLDAEAGSRDVRASLVPGQSNEEILAGAQPDGAVGIEPMMDLVEPGTAVEMRGPETPSEEERIRHGLTHIPAKPWCEVCVAAKGRDAVHRTQGKKEDLVPVIQFDYGESGVANDPHNNFKMLVGVDTSSGGCNATGVQRKGATDKYAIESMASFVHDLGYSAVILRSDAEPSIVAFLEALKARLDRYENMKRVQLQTAPVHSHQSVGAAERFIQTIRAQMRALILDLQRRFGIEVGPTSPLLPWAARHAAWLYNRYHRRDGVTAYERLHLTRYSKPLLIFGECCICRRPGAQLNKLEIHWLHGIWLGRDSKTDEHFIGTEGGIVRARAVRRMIESQQWIKERVLAMEWTPWRTSAAVRG